MSTRKTLAAAMAAISPGRTEPGENGDWYPHYYRVGSRRRIAGGPTPEAARANGRAYLLRELRRELPTWAWPTAPVRYASGNSSVPRESGEYYLPTLARASAWARRKVARWYLGGRRPSKDSPLWGEWFYGSEAPEFRWLRWALAVRHEVDGADAPATRAESRAARAGGAR